MRGSVFWKTPSHYCNWKPALSEEKRGIVPGLPLAKQWIDLHGGETCLEFAQDTGYTVHEAEGAEAGLRKARKEIPDVIIIDYQLPGMSGLQALEKIIADPRICNIPCIIVTASATERDIEVMEASDAWGYITKPVNTRTFAGRIEEMAALRR